MHIGLVGSTSAGKTTFARGLLEACEARGLEAWLSEDFAARQLGVHGIRAGFVRRRALEFASLLYCVASWRRYRDYHALAFRLIRDAPGSWIYKAGLVRLTLRKTGIHEIVRRSLRDGQVVISDNEAALQGAHHLFVHPDGDGGRTGVDSFAALAPKPDVVLYLRTSEPVIVERILRRGHRRLGTGSLERVERSVRDTVELFDRLCAAPAVSRRLLLVEARDASDTGVSYRNGDRLVKVAGELAAESLQAARGASQQPSPSKGFTPEPELVGHLFAALNEGVRYCHWKSNFKLGEAGEEGGDLDLLVDPLELPRTRQVLAQLGFREAVVPLGPRSPGVWHFYGLDPSDGSLVHVHLFSRVLTGESFVKSHRLPLERMLLENVERLGTVQVPTKAAELVLFVLRTFVKYGSLPDLLRLARDADSVRAEFRWLETQCSVPDALSLLRTHCPAIEEALFLECLNCLHHDEPLIRRLILARRVRRRLRVYATRSALGRWAAYLQFLLARGRTKLRGTKGKKAWHSGGVLIAFVGPDATGKSTLVGETARWLSSACATEIVHLGKPRSSMATAPLNGALAVLRAFRGRRRRWKPDSLPGGHADRTNNPGWAAIVYGLRAVALAFDRRRAVRKAWLSATRGGVVVCDRYPTSELGAMDGPRLPREPRAPGLGSALYGALAQIEERLYRGLPQPDLLIKLSVSLETARLRNREREKADKHTDEDLEGRHQSLGSWSIPEGHCQEVSTEASVEETLARVKQVIWRAV